MTHIAGRRSTRTVLAPCVAFHTLAIGGIVLAGRRVPAVNRIDVFSYFSSGGVIALGTVIAAGGGVLLPFEKP